VNPAQFGDPSDLAAYPRDLDADLDVSRRAGVDVIFAPSVAEMFPQGSLVTAVVPGSLAAVLEGRCRPGHFTGVATVVAKLLSLAGTCRAYFGEKDFQQLAVVSRLVTDLDLDVAVVGCPTVRERDGLAMSSRNGRLSAGERRAATALWRALRTGRELVAAGVSSGDKVSAAMVGVLSAEPLVHTDYAVVADPESLQGVSDIAGEVRLLIGARIGTVRLIDNVSALPPAVGNRARSSDTVDPVEARRVRLSPMRGRT